MRFECSESSSTNYAVSESDVRARDPAAWNVPLCNGQSSRLWLTHVAHPREP
jgi:hypothetical protein